MRDEEMEGSEAELRGRIDETVTRVRKALARYPAEIRHEDVGTVTAARDLIDEMVDDLGELTAANTELGRVAEVSSDALLLCGATSVAIRLLSDTLATLVAELDSGHLAA